MCNKNVGAILFFCFFGTAFAVQCIQTDPQTGAAQNCYGQFCTFWKFDQLNSGGNLVPVVMQGCYNWTSTATKRLGCYKTYDQPQRDLKNGLICICQQDFCNTEQQANAAPAQIAKSFTCLNSGANTTCTGYACVTVKL